MTHQILTLAILLLLARTSVQQFDNLGEYEASAEKKLIKEILERYERAGVYGRPVKNPKEVIKVEFGISLFQILELKERDQILNVKVWTNYAWTDPLLRWSPANYSGIEEVRIPSENIWVPDIVLYNYADERLKEQRSVMLMIDYQGRVFWSPPAIFKSTCSIDITYFPFDSQICHLNFASATNDLKKLNLSLFDGENEVNIDHYMSSNEWELKTRPALRAVRTKNEEETPQLIFFLVLERNAAFYGYLLVLPCILLSLLNLVIFWLPPQIPAKMILGMNIFVAFSLLLRILAKMTPTSSRKVPYIGFYYCLNMILISLSTLFSIIVIHMHFRADKCSNIPGWLTNIIKRLSRLHGIKCELTDISKPREPEKSLFEKAQEKAKNEQSRRNDFPANQTEQLENNISDIRVALCSLMTKIHGKDKNAKRYKEWRSVGLVIDRTLFWLYLIIIIVSGFVMLYPRKKIWDDEEVKENYRREMMRAKKHLF